MSDLHLIIGNKNYSSWSLRPWLLLRHLAIPFKETRIPLSTDQFKQQISPFSDAGKVPVLEDGKHCIWESLAICERLAEQHPQLWPADTHQRSLARSAVCEMHAGFMALRNELPMNCRAHGRTVNYSQAAALDIRRIDDLWSQLRAQASSGPWLFGQFGIIDAYFAPVAIRFHGYQVPLSETAQAYVTTQLSNPLLQEWIAAGIAEQEVIQKEEIGE